MWSDSRRSVRAAPGLIRRVLDPEQNPFLAAELRIQARNRSLPRSLLLHALALGLLFLGLLALGQSPWDPEPHPWRGWFMRHLLVGIAAVHVWLIIHASDSRARAAAQREETDRMWEMLLVTPLSPPEIVLYKSVYPFLYASLIALLGLPLYVLTAAMSGMSLGLVAGLYGVYALLMLRLVAPVPPITGRAPGGRRPRPAASITGSVIGMVWLLSFLGRALRPVTPLAMGMIVTWPVVAAILLPTPFAFFDFHLAPLAVLLALGPSVLILNLRWAARRLVVHASEAPELAPPGLLQRAVVLGFALTVLGYAWPVLVQAGRLGVWMGTGSSPGDSAAALVWVLLALWWLLFGVGGLLSIPTEAREAEGTRAPRFWSGWLSPARPDRAVAAAVTALVGPPLLLLGLGCLLGGQGPTPSLLPWLGQTVLVAGGAAALTAILAARIREATLGGKTTGVAAGWSCALVLLVAPLLLLLWPDRLTLQLASLSPALGFLTLLPDSAPHSPAALAPLPPWWLAPMLNLGAALLLGRRRPQTGACSRSTAAARPEDGLLSRWAERFGAWRDNPVLVKELRAGARRGPGRQWLSKAGLIALVLLILGVYNPRIITGLAESVPLRLVHPDRPGGTEVEDFFEALMAVMILVLSWPVVFSSPVLGAGTFSLERRKGTLGFLLLTPLREASIVRGKLLGALAPLLLTLGLTFPLAALAALLSASPRALWTVLFGYTWLLVACFTGGAFGALASLLWPADRDPQGAPLLAMLLLQAAKLYLAARLQHLLTGASWVTGKLEITAWFVIPLVALEAVVGFAAYSACVTLLTRARCRDVRFVTEK